MEETSLDESWITQAYEVAGPYHKNEYLMGAEEFQKKAIKELEYKIILSEEIIKKFPLNNNKLYFDRIETLKESIEIITNLKN